MSDQDQQEQISSGVEELIERLRIDGVDAGRQEADTLLAKAREEAQHIITQQKEEVDRYREEATAAIAAERDAATEALKQASRDTLLQLEKQITQVFAQRLKSAVQTELQDPGVLKDMILQAAGRAGGSIPENAAIEIELPEGTDPAVLGITNEMIREGFSVQAGDQREGIKLRFTDGDMEIDLSGDALSTLLLRQLVPTFQKLLRGHLSS